MEPTFKPKVEGFGYLNKVWLKLPRSLRMVLSVVGALLFFGAGVLVTFQTIYKNQLEIAEKRARLLTPAPSPSKDSNDLSAYTPSTLGCFNLGTDWLGFLPEEWQGLNSKFSKLGDNIYTLPNPAKKVDSVAYYSKLCLASFAAQFGIIPLSETLLNLNLYFDSWFRWEVGGKDLRSVRLFKNADGCTSAMNSVIRVPLDYQYLPDHDKILPEEPILIKFSVYETKFGYLRTELDFEYTSSKTKEKVNVSGRFYHEFEIGDSCNNNTVLDIKNDSFRIGIGLQPASIYTVSIAENPKVKLEKFKIEPHTEK